jgi:hypothetical protein
MEQEMPSTVPVSAIRLRRRGRDIEVLAEVDEEWRLVMYSMDANWGKLDVRTADVNTIMSAPLDWNTSELQPNQQQGEG